MQPILGKAGKYAFDPLGFLPLNILAWCLSPALPFAGDMPFLWDLSWEKVEPEVCDSDLLREVVVLVFILRRCCGEFLLSVLFNTASYYFLFSPETRVRGYCSAILAPLAAANPYFLTALLCLGRFCLCPRSLLPCPSSALSGARLIIGTVGSPSLQIFPGWSLSIISLHFHQSRAPMHLLSFAQSPPNLLELFWT